MKKYIRFIIPAAFLAISGLVILFLFTYFKTDFIVHQGIRSYNSMKRIVYIYDSISFLLLILSLGYAFRRWRKDIEETTVRIRDEEISQKQKTESEAFLSVKALNPVSVRNVLRQEAESKWESLKDNLFDLESQLYQMSRYRTKLKNLLSENDAAILSNTEDVLSDVEQYLARNARKVLNYMNISDSSVAEQCDRVQDLLTESINDNEEKLLQVDGFLVRIADFLNSQGDDDDGTEMLELYSNTLLESIQEKEEDI